MKLDLSVIMPCYGRPEGTRAALASLAACPDEFEVVVVDDASPVSLAPIVREFEQRLEVRYVRQPTNQGPAAARNRGVAVAKHDIIAFTDNDCVVEPLWPRELGHYLRDAPRKVAAVGGRVLAQGDDLISSYFTWHKILDPYVLDGRYLYVVTANCAFRREALAAVGGFDERIRQAGGEDPGVCFKLLEAGWSLHYRKEALVWHDYRMGLKEFAKTFYRYGKGCRLQTDLHAQELSRSAGHGAAVSFGGMDASRSST